MARRRHAEDFADLCLSAYLQQTPPRSLARLQHQFNEAGVEVSLATLKRYSSTFDWQHRIAETEKTASKRRQTNAIETVFAMQERHTQLARAMQGAGGSALQRLLTSDARLTGLKPGEIARLIDLGLRSERQAIGAATDRREIAVEICNDLVLDLVYLFREINDEPDTQTRARLFARRLDDLITLRLDQLQRKEERS